MASPPPRLNILIFPMMGQGHMLPALDMAKLFASRGALTTVLTTPANAPQVQTFIDRVNSTTTTTTGEQNPIQLRLIPFPPGSATGLPEGMENQSSVPQNLKPNFYAALPMLRLPFQQVLQDLAPDAVVTGTFFPWTYDVAEELGIPRLFFRGSNFFSNCADYSIGPQSGDVLENLPEDVDTLVLPGLPHRIEMFKSLLPNFKVAAPFLVDLIAQMNEANSKSYGEIVNSFYELEPEYADYYRDVIGKRAWHVGPMCLSNEDAADMSCRGSTANAACNDDAFLKWLDSRSPGSVLYAGFGSTGEFTKDQLREIALGLEASNRPFIWAVTKASGHDTFLPEGFEERVAGRGLVVRGWAPQMLILNHAAVGGFLTHCGWNSSLEGISVGLPMITWPLFAEQNFNERLLVDVLGIGVAIGVKDYTWDPTERELVVGARVAEAVGRLMGEGEDAAERRRKAKELGKKARKAVEKGGSSYVDMDNLIKELMENRKCAAV